MVSASVIVVDYGSGNLFSVMRALEHCGAKALATDDPTVIAEASRIVLPGVGAFADGMQGLRDRGLIEPLRRHADLGRPLLGICLGMQMLASASEEFGTHEGLGIVPGWVRAIPPVSCSGVPHKIPHIGWAELLEPHHAPSWQGSLLEGTVPGTAVYLVHSFAVEPDDDAHRLADCDYGGYRLCAALKRNNVVGTQFHPEKSGPAGLAMLTAFLHSS